jgi:hypothetical protein
MILLVTLLVLLNDIQCIPDWPAVCHLSITTAIPITAIHPADVVPAVVTHAVAIVNDHLLLDHLSECHQAVLWTF